MTILELARGIPFLSGGQGLFEYDQAKALAAVGHKVIIAAVDLRSFRHKRKQGITVTEKDGMYIYSYSFPVGNLPKPLLRVFAFSAFKKLYSRILKAHGKPDVAHAHFGRGMGAVALRAKKKYGLKYVVTEHDSLVFRNLISVREKKKLRGIYENAEKVVAVSSALSNRIRDIYSIDDAVIPNIADLEAFRLSSPKPHDGYIFVSVGNLNRNKGFDILLKAFAAVKDKDVRLNIVGAGSENSALLELAERLDISDKVSFLGYKSREAISDLFVSSDCFILTSRCETFGVVYIEAMSCGLPVIATKCGGPSDFVNDENGILIDTGSVEQAAEAMRNMAEGKKNYDRQRISQGCSENFSSEKFAERFNGLLKELEL